MVMPMTGLEEIKAAIAQESRLECDRIEQQAQQQIAAIQAGARASAEARYEDILAQARRECTNRLQMARTGGEMEIRRLLLRTKAELVEETIQLALHQLRELPEKKYFDALALLTQAYARQGDGELRLSARDLERLPSNFAANLNEVLLKQNARIHIGGQPAQIDGGLVLAYGDIEVNCSFQALVEDAREELRDLLSRALFAPPVEG